MDRTAGQFCSREYMARVPNETIIPDTMPPIAAREQSNGNAMTWQQKKDFGPAANAHERKSKAVRWESLNFEAIKDPPVTSTTGGGDNWSVEQSAVPTVESRHHLRGKAVASPSCHSSQPHLFEPSLPGDADNGKKSSQKKPRKNPRQNYKKNASGGSMSTLPKSAFVPPHLRSCAAAAKATKGEKIAATITITNGSTAASDKSKTSHSAKVHSSPNGASPFSKLPHSMPTTPREPQSGEDEAGRDVEENRATHKLKKAQILHTSGEGQAPLELQNVKENDWGHWDVSPPHPISAVPERENPRWPRARDSLKKTMWPKQRDMKATLSDSSSDGGVTFKSNSDGDPNYDVKKLMDWNGDWLPPPEQWAARKGYTSRHFGYAIELWMNGHGAECLEPMIIPSTVAEGNVCKELVPVYWTLPKIEQKSLGEFWKLMPKQEPPALSDVDIFADPPFWDRYAEGPGCFINGLDVPDAHIDPSDPENHFAGADLLVSANERVQRIMEQKKIVHRRSLAKQKRPLREALPTTPLLPDRRIQPKSNVYFRPVQPADVQGIAAIYNHYVEFTIFANEFDGRTEPQIRNRIDDIIKAGLPYLVAVARGNQPKALQGYVNEKIVGYASLDDYCDQSSMYRYTFELELYVHPGYQSQNIASCLLDRLLEMANTGYNACGGYEYQNDFEYLKTGPSRVIKVIMLAVQKEHGEDESKTSDYLKKFKFYRAGHIPQMGFKLGKVVDTLLFRHTTTEVIDPNGRPSV